ncbi:MAG: 4Fe-4S binding protein [Gammaproteobacteria bacterium]|nr:4Fe-4S binding protein [Gammaproteobacteria bacterium]MBU1654474.1 4Fe-4S binding protein [Gammaproteobacteria bacterium]MBU1962632.1 4Fe-4S binding protein [Gammaproteobacteria bacterium]
MTTEKRPKNKPPISPKRREQSRREFLRTGAMAGGVLLISLMGYIPVGEGKMKRLRPPGALIDKDLNERDFLAACIKCGQCVQVCPVEAIKLTDLADGFGIGTPFIEARDQACDFSCDGLQCVLACPTGALTHEINYPAQSRMGFARLTRPEKCLAIQGQGFKGQARGPDFKGVLRYEELDRWKAVPIADHPYDLELCDLCVRQCPIEIRIGQCAAGKPPSGDKNQCPPSRAISLESMGEGKARKPLVHDGCVGCGVCEMVCPTDPPAIVIVLDETADTQRKRG